MAKNATNFTPGMGDEDWDGIDHKHERDLENIRKHFPSQQLKLFRDKETGKLVAYRAGYSVFYLSSDGREWCADCANQELAEPPIIAGQATGHVDRVIEIKVCAGCLKHIHPIRIVRQNANARYIYNFQTGTVLCIAFETPIAMYMWESDTVYVTDIDWSASMSKQVNRFWSTMSKEPLRKERWEGTEGKYYTNRDTCPQEQLDEILEKWTYDVRLPETRSAHERYNQGVGYRVNTRQYVGRYDDLRRQLANRKTHKVVITDKV